MEQPRYSDIRFENFQWLNLLTRFWSLGLIVITQTVLTANPSLAAVKLEAQLRQLINDTVSVQEPTSRTLKE